MTRPTTRDLAEAGEDLELIAYAHDPHGSPRNNTAFPPLAKLLNLLAWIDSEIRAADRAAAYGPGVKDGYHQVHRGGTPTDLDSRTRDAHAKALRNLRSGWAHELARIADEWQREAMDIGQWPTRTATADPLH